MFTYIQINPCTVTQIKVVRTVLSPHIKTEYIVIDGHHTPLLSYAYGHSDIEYHKAYIISFERSSCRRTNWTSQT